MMGAAGPDPAGASQRSIADAALQSHVPAGELPVQVLSLPHPVLPPGEALALVPAGGGLLAGSTLTVMARP